MHAFHIVLVLFAILSLVGFGFLIRWERRQYMARGLAGSWLAVRLSTIPIAFATAALVVIPARSTSGMEGLAVLYLLLFSAAPIVWFGSHWLVGRISRPPMLFADSARVAGSPIVYLITVAMIAHLLQSLAWSLLRSLGVD